MDTQAIRAELEQVLRDLDTTSETLESEGAGETSELSHVTQHPGDVGTDIADNDREIALLEANADRRAEVEAALARIDAGTYGTCVVCGRAVEPARLEFRPESARCLADQQEYEAQTA